MNAGYMVRETGTNLRRNPSLTLASVLTVGVSLFLVGASLLIGEGAKNSTANFKNGVQVIVFLNPTISGAQRDAVGRFISGSPLVKSRSYVDKAQAYKEYRRLFKDEPDMLDSVQPQQLPTSFTVIPKEATVDSVDQLTRLLSGRPGVLRVLGASEALRRLQRLGRLSSTGLTLTASCLLVASFLLIVNTIRMAALARRREIEVMKLVGATNWFIRIPFMLEGLVQGIVGAFFATGGVFVLARVLKDRLDTGGNLLDPATVGHGSFDIASNYVWGTAVLLLVLGAVISVVGSGFAASRFVDV